MGLGNAVILALTPVTPDALCTVWVVWQAATVERGRDLSLWRGRVVLVKADMCGRGEGEVGILWALPRVGGLVSEVPEMPPAAGRRRSSGTSVRAWARTCSYSLADVHATVMTGGGGGVGDGELVVGEVHRCLQVDPIPHAHSVRRPTCAAKSARSHARRETGCAALQRKITRGGVSYSQVRSTGRRANRPTTVEAIELDAVLAARHFIEVGRFGRPAVVRRLTVTLPPTSCEVGRKGGGIVEPGS